MKSSHTLDKWKNSCTSWHGKSKKTHDLRRVLAPSISGGGLAGRDFWNHQQFCKSEKLMPRKSIWLSKSIGRIDVAIGGQQHGRGAIDGHERWEFNRASYGSGSNQKGPWTRKNWTNIFHRIHIWYIYLHLSWKSNINIGRFLWKMQANIQHTWILWLWYIKFVRRHFWSMI